MKISSQLHTPYTDEIQAFDPASLQDIEDAEEPNIEEELGNAAPAAVNEDSEVPVYFEEGIGPEETQISGPQVSGPQLSGPQVLSSATFEQMKRQLGDVILELQRYRREHHDLMISILDSDHSAATAKHAESYRTNMALIMTGAKCALGACAVVSIATPQVFFTGGQQLANLGVDLVGRFNGDINLFSDAAQKLFSALENVTESGKQLIETRQQGDRVECSAAEQRMKSFLDRRHQDHVQALRDEIEELRKLEEMVKREHDIISLVCR